MPLKNNYQNRLDGILETVPEGTRLLLHACCAPCSSYTLEYLTQFFSIQVFYYNPNITDAGEYAYRLSELHRLVELLPQKHPAQVIEGTYEPQCFYALAQGHEQEPERGTRCQRCIAHRLEETFRYAAAMSEPPAYICTTLSISPHKDAEFINQTGYALSEQYGIAWLPGDFKKKGGYLRSIALSGIYGLYRQDYCGCIYSQQAAQKRKREQGEQKNEKQ